MALGTPVVAAAAYSASGGTTVSPAYPAGILATDAVLLFVGQKPSTANSGTVTTPSGWTLRDELTGAGGYGATLGADTGNTNLRVYSWNTPVAGQTGTLAVTLGTNNVSWAFMVRIPSGGGALSYGSADGQRTTTPTSPMSIALTNGATATDFQTGDVAIWAMCIPTDVTTPSQFSNQDITATGAVFGTPMELNEPDSTTGNDIGGYSAWDNVDSGSSTTAPTVVTNLTGTLTNVRGPVVLLRVRETVVAVTHTTTGALTGPGSTVAGSADRQSASVTHATSGALTGPGSAVAGAASRTRAHATTGVLPGQTATITGAADRQAGAVTHATTGALTGPGASVIGASARTRAHPTTGVLSGQGATVAGTARHNIPHASAGALTGPGAAIAGASARTRVHLASGSLTGDGAVIVGTATVTSPYIIVTHDTSGVLTGPGASVAGAAARTRQHATTGVLPGQEAIVVGASAISTTHTTDGVLIGAGAVVAGTANRISLYPDPSEVAAGVQYGPGGIYVGTLTATPGQNTIGLRSFTGRF